MNDPNPKSNNVRRAEVRSMATDFMYQLVRAGLIPQFKSVSVHLHEENSGVPGEEFVTHLDIMAV